MYILPQIRAMYNGDRARKELVDLVSVTSAMDNRPKKKKRNKLLANNLCFRDTRITNLMYPQWLPSKSFGRPLVDPEMEIRPINGQVEDFIGEVRSLEVARRPCYHPN